MIAPHAGCNNGFEMGARARRSRAGRLDKAVVVFPDGSQDDSAWNQAKAIAQAKKLPDGAPVTEVRIVVPRRDQVAAVTADAKAAGFAAVLYADEQGSFWDPDPPGAWRAAAGGSRDR